MHTVGFKDIQHSCLKPVLSQNSTFTLHETNYFKQVLSCNHTFTLHASKCFKMVSSVCISTALDLTPRDVCSCYKRLYAEKIN